MSPTLYSIVLFRNPFWSCPRESLGTQPRTSTSAPEGGAGVTILLEKQELRGADGAVCCFTVTLARSTVTFDDDSLLQVRLSKAVFTESNAPTFCAMVLMPIKNPAFDTFILSPTLLHAGSRGRCATSRTAEALAPVKGPAEVARR